MKYGWYYTQVASRGAQNKSRRDASPEGKRTLKIEDQTVQTTLKFLKSPAPERARDESEFLKSTKVQTNSKRVRELRKVDVFLTGKNLNMRVRSWLRMNAGGVLNTCKSNGVLRMKFSDGFFNT